MIRRIVLVSIGIVIALMLSGIGGYWLAREKWFPFHGWKYIVIHHSATTSGNAESFHRAHVARGIPGGLAYHFVIGNGRGSKNGELEKGHRWSESKAGGHVTIKAWNYNVYGIGICLVGNFETTTPTDIQWQALVKKTVQLCRQYAIAPENILGHKDVPFFFDHHRTAQTACPGRYLDINALRRDVYRQLALER